MQLKLLFVKQFQFSCVSIYSFYIILFPFEMILISWCNPCKALMPRIETVIQENEGKVDLAKVST